jgi:class 3 adenylate cyclase/TPR repeat protein
MAEAPLERRLAAILAADVAGYSRLMGADEEGTLRQLKAHRKELIDPKITEHRGHIVKTTGDGMLVEFVSVVDAVRCAIDIQRVMVDRNVEVAAEKRIEFRIGINVGDIISDEDDIFGDGVNIAARIETLAAPGAFCLSDSAYQPIKRKVALDVSDMGEFQLKNIVQPVRVYSVRIAALPAPPTDHLNPADSGDAQTPHHQRSIENRIRAIFFAALAAVALPVAAFVFIPYLLSPQRPLPAPYVPKPPHPTLPGPLEDGVDAYKRGDYAKAFRLFQALTAQGNATAQTNLGSMYRYGQGVPQDYQEAAKLYRLAAAQGNATAQTNLGGMYRYGGGVPQDYQEAVKLYRLAAAQGNATAQTNLGGMYRSGQGVPPNYVLSHMWLTISIANGGANAANILHSFVAQMTSAQIVLAQDLARRCKESNYKQCGEPEGTSSSATPAPAPSEGTQVRSLAPPAVDASIQPRVNIISVRPVSNAERGCVEHQHSMINRYLEITDEQISTFCNCYSEEIRTNTAPDIDLITRRCNHEAKIE